MVKTKHLSNHAESKSNERLHNFCNKHDLVMLVKAVIELCGFCRTEKRHFHFHLASDIMQIFCHTNSDGVSGALKKIELNAMRMEWFEMTYLLLL